MFNSVLSCFTVCAYKCVVYIVLQLFVIKGNSYLSILATIFFTITIMEFCFLMIMLVVSYCVS